LKNIIVLEGLHLKEGLLCQEDCSTNHHLKINIMELERLPSGQSSQVSQTHLRNKTIHNSLGEKENLQLKEGTEDLDDHRVEHHLNKKSIRDKIQKPSKEFKRTIQSVQIPKKVWKTTRMGLQWRFHIKLVASVKTSSRMGQPLLGLCLIVCYDTHCELVLTY
jgi:hypothetical protein